MLWETSLLSRVMLFMCNIDSPIGQSIRESITAGYWIIVCVDAFVIRQCYNAMELANILRCPHLLDYDC